MGSFDPTSFVLLQVADYSMSTNVGSPHVVTYVPGAKGAPSFCRIYQFPNFEENQVIANKSFYQADTVDLKWNGPGTAVLVLTQVSVNRHQLNILPFIFPSPRLPEWGGWGGGGSMKLGSDPKYKF